MSGLTFWELEASRNPVPSASALAAASENEVGPNAPAENPTLKPRRFNADEPIWLVPRFDTLGGKTCPPCPGACACIELIVTPKPIARAATTMLFLISLILISYVFSAPFVLTLGLLSRPFFQGLFSFQDPLQSGLPSRQLRRAVHLPQRSRP
jgi:hypothetical protein